ESTELFAVLRRVVRDEHRAVLLISHKLDEVLHATDRVTIMRNGRVVAERPTAETTAAELAREMIGRPVSLRSMSAAAVGFLEAAADEPVAVAAEPPQGPILLSVRDARAVAPDGRTVLDGVSLQVRPGEILGLAGGAGNREQARRGLLAT